MKIFNISILFCLLLTVSSCVKFDEFYSSEDFPGDEIGSSTYNLELVLSEGYRFWSQAVVKEHLADANVICDITEANLEGDFVGAYRAKYDYSRLDFKNDNMWEDAYKSINQANHILAITDADNQIDNIFESQRARMRGEATFLRAYNHFMLLRYYAKQYTASTANTDAGIILRTTPAEDFSTGGRSSVAEGYALVLEDLELAIASLPENFSSNDHGTFPAYQFRANKFDAVSLKARVLLQMNDIDEALEVVSSLIGKPNTAPEFPAWAPAGLKMATGDGVLDLFRSESLAAGSELRTYVANYAISEPFTLMERIKLMANGVQSSIYLKDSFSEMYLDDKGDFLNSDTLRLRNFIKEVVVENEAGVATDTTFIYQKFSLTTGINTNWPTIRLAELLLMRAELLAVRGGSSAALKDLNLLRSLRGAQTVAGAPNPAEVLELVIRERMLELVGEGERFFHWKRMGAYNATVSDIYPESVYAPFSRTDQADIRWDSPQTLFRLPVNEINRNPDLSEADQNP